MAVEYTGKAIITEVLDSRGRYISKDEWRWLMTVPWKKDYLSCTRLCLALCMDAGLRLEDGVRAKISWFNSDFSFMKMSQCKPHVTKKDGILRAKVKPRDVPISSGLAQDLRDFMAFRLACGRYVGYSIKDGRLFPYLSKQVIMNFFCKIRRRFGTQYPWLLDKWQVVRVYQDGKLVREQPTYRISSHMCRRGYVGQAWYVCRKDIMATKAVTGYSKTKDLEVYVTTLGIAEKKQEIANRMEALFMEQKTPILLGQKRLADFG